VIFRRHFAIQEEFGISEVISSKKRESKASRKKMLARKRIELLTNDLYLDEIKNEKDELILDDGEENEVEKGDIRANPLPEELAFTEKVIVEKKLNVPDGELAALHLDRQANPEVQAAHSQENIRLPRSKARPHK